MLFSRVTPAVANHHSRLQRENQAPAKGEDYSGGKMSFHITRRENRVRNHTIKGLALVAGALLVAVALSVPANAATLRKGSQGGATSVTGSEPGSVLWTYFDTCTAFVGPDTNETETIASPCKSYGFGDNIIRLINPNGGSSAVGGSVDTPVCANIYVFDDDQEMVACCSCPLTSNSLKTLSVDKNLLAEPILSSGAPDGIIDGSVAIVASLQSTSDAGSCTPFGPYTNAAATANLLGSITHNQIIGNNEGGSTSGLTEVGLFDDADGDAANVTYLKEECTNLVGNGSTAGVCGCGFGT